MCDVREFQMPDGECRVHSSFVCAGCGARGMGIATMRSHDDHIHGGARCEWVSVALWETSH